MAIDVRKLIEAGVHFGHQRSKWCPKMAPYIWGERNKTHLIDISKTATQLEQASQFLHSIVASGKQVLFLGTKRAAQDTIKKIGLESKMPYVDHRFVGGTLTNWSQVRKSLTRLLHLEDVLAKSKDAQFYTKKELSIFNKMVARLDRYVGGLRNFVFNELGAIVVVDVDKERSAVLEASAMNIPIVALVDTNTDPSLIDYVIPANDDSPQAIETIFSYLQDAVNSALVSAEKAKQEKKQAASDKRAASEQNQDGHRDIVNPNVDESAISSTFGTEDSSEEIVPTPASKKSARSPRPLSAKPSGTPGRKNIGEGNSGNRASAFPRAKKQG